MTSLPRAVVFDLDGTLVDSIEDIAASMNVSLATVGRPGHDLATYRRFVGDGLRALAARAAAGADEATIDRVVASFRAHYGDHLCDATRPYPGIPEMVRGLRAAGIRTAVLSNKPHDATRRLVSALFGDDAFDDVLGQLPGAPTKPDPAPARAQLARLGVRAEHAALVGDSEMDVATALSCGMWPVGVSWGFRSVATLREAGAAVVVDRADELPPLLLAHFESGNAA
ncbi:MAG: HAD family hydrolase [Polyangiales bacterium]